MVTASVLAFDLHSDILADVYRKRMAGEHRVIVNRHLPQLRQGGVGAVCCAIWVEPKYRSKGIAHVMKLIDCLAAELRESPAELALCRTLEEMERAIGQGKLAIVLTVEGLGSVAALPGMLDLLAMVGVRMASLTWNERNLLGAGASCGRRTGLTQAGRRTLREMAALGMILDVSHLNDAAFWDALEEAKGPVVASHSNCRALCDVGRNLTDDQITAIARTGGVIGVNSWPEFVDPAEPTLDRFVDHMEHIASLVGVSHVALGLDFCNYLDGDSLSSFSSVNKQTKGLEDASKVGSIAETMLKRGFSEDEVRRVFFLNAVELFRRNKVEGKLYCETSMCERAV